MKVMVFGPFGGHSSYPIVMRGLTSAFQELGLEVVKADISNIDSDVPLEWIQFLSRGQAPEGLAREIDVAFVMKPSFQMAEALFKSGVKVVGLHVGDVSRIPDEWKLAMRFEHLIVTPSTWMASVIRDAIGDAPIFVANHGIQPEYLETTAAPPSENEPFRFLHFCSSGVFPERKGTPQALSAFQKLSNSRRSVALTLVVPELRRRHKRLLAALSPGARNNVFISTYSHGMGPKIVIEKYQQHHALLAPSRAEGFGLMTLEARACGRPVVQTICTGFADHFEETGPRPEELGVVQVPHGNLAPAWGDFGEAPSVKVDDVYNAMEYMIDHYEELAKAAMSHVSSLTRWSWTEQTRELVEKLKELS